MPQIVKVQNLTKSFKDLVAVSDVSFFLEPGEILGLLGPNGAGKTTTFQMLLGVLTPTNGTIEYFGKDFFKARESILERVNFCSTYTNLPHNLKVRDSFAFITKLYQIAEPKKRLAEIIDVFRLSSLLNKEAISLSAGEQTRVNLAKAFINNPEIVLLDEPTASLDPESAHFVREYILEKRKQSGLSVLFTSHNMSEVEATCDRVVFIQKGKVIADGTPKALAQTLDRCFVSFICEEHLISSAMEIAKNFNAIVEVKENELTAQMSEKNVPEYLNILSSKGFIFHGLEVKSASLEDYFLSQAAEITRLVTEAKGVANV